MFSLSGDTRFSPVGAITLKEYEQVFRGIKKLLVLQAHTKAVQRIFKEYDERLFVNTGVSVDYPSESSSATSPEFPSVPASITTTLSMIEFGDDLGSDSEDENSTPLKTVIQPLPSASDYNKSFEYSFLGTAPDSSDSDDAGDGISILSGMTLTTAALQTRLRARVPTTPSITVVQPAVSEAVVASALVTAQPTALSTRAASATAVATVAQPQYSGAQTPPNSVQYDDDAETADTATTAPPHPTGIEKRRSSGRAGAAGASGDVPEVVAVVNPPKRSRAAPKPKARAVPKPRKPPAASVPSPILSPVPSPVLSPVPSPAVSSETSHITTEPRKTRSRKAPP